MPARRWARLGVDVRLETPIERIDATGIVARGERIEAATVVWCAGVRAMPVGRWLGVPTERNGTVRVGADLSVPGHERIFVLGDAAFAAGPDGRSDGRRGGKECVSTCSSRGSPDH